jgi:hypothetical protein
VIFSKLIKKAAIKAGLVAPGVAGYWDDQKYLEKTEFKYVLWLYEVYKKIHRVPGHVVELGVAYGRNAIIFSHLIHMHNEQDIRQYIGFDTFDGYTDDTLMTDKHLSATAWKNISIEKVKERIRKAGDFRNCTLIKGDLTVTLTEYLKAHPDFRAALLYVDCNAYSPALKGMRLLKEFMSPGGVICIDEKRQGGETRALIEFCKENNLKFVKDISPFSIPAYTVIE